MSRKILIKVVHTFSYIELGLLVTEKKRESALYGIPHIWPKRVHVKLLFVLTHPINRKSSLSGKHKPGTSNMKDYVKTPKIS